MTYRAKPTNQVKEDNRVLELYRPDFHHLTYGIKIQS